MIPDRCTRLRLLVFVSILPLTPLAWACSCEGPRGRDILRAHASVFTGRAVEIQYLERHATDVEAPIVVTFDVYEVWKGPVRHTAVLRTVYNTHTCAGYYFKVGRDYLVAAKNVIGDRAESSSYELEGIFLCGGTRLLSEARQDLTDLGNGTTPR